jgi:hypothetical protein
MTNNVFDLISQGLRSGGGPPTIDPMEERMRTVEQAIARIDATLPGLATKADLHKEIGDQSWKIILWMTGICGALVGAVFLIAKAIL